MSKSYLDKETGLWKWGTNGKPVHKTQEDCDKFGIKQVYDRLCWIRDNFDKVIRGK